MYFKIPFRPFPIALLAGLLLHLSILQGQDLVISGVIDGPLSGGVPKAVELFVLNDIADLSAYGLGSANNGGGTDGEEYTFPAVSASKGDYLYVASESDGFNSFFGFAPDYTSSALAINGDDAVELFFNGSVADVFGEIDVDGTGQPWEHLDGWAYRIGGTGPDGSTFVLDNWTFSGPNALDGETTNAGATVPFPIGTYGGPAPVVPRVLISEIMQNPSAVSDSEGEYFELYNAGTEPIDINGWTIKDNDNDSHLIDNSGKLVIATGEYLVLAINADEATNGGVPVDYQYPDNFFLSNSSDELVLLDAEGNEVDRVEWDNGATFPDPNGASMILDPDQLEGDNNDGSNWCVSTSAYGAGDFGTPGAANDGCTTQVPLFKIHEIQGLGSEVAISGEVAVEAIVTTDFFDGETLEGFFLQEEDADADNDPLTSEGLYVFCGNCTGAVSVGDLVRVSGTAGEFAGTSQIDIRNGSVEVLGPDNALPTPVKVGFSEALPTNDPALYEQYECMLVEFDTRLVVSEYFQLQRFGQIVLTAEARPLQFTQVAQPGVAGFSEFQEELAKKIIILEDDNDDQNASLPDGILPYPQPNGFGVGEQGPDFFRGGDVINNLTGVLRYDFGNWRVRPVEEVYPVQFVPENSRNANKTPSAVGGNLKVATFNVLNYFTTLDDGSTRTSVGEFPRGANSSLELERQTAKIVSALVEIDADVVGLVELENSTDDAPIAALVQALNDRLGEEAYAYIPTGQVGDDAITVGVIYKIATVSPLGEPAVLDDPAFTDPSGSGEQRNRPAVAQTFRVADVNNPDFGGVFTVAVNHFKSKGSSGVSSTSPDADQNDGQGNWNFTRALAAEALADWLASDPTGSGDPDFLILGDLNAYRNEDPIKALESRGYTDLLEEEIGDEAYTFVFDGQLGYLDYAMSNTTLTSQVNGITSWHINADEVNAFDYNDPTRDPGEASFEAKPSGNPLYEANAFRSSDHDPVVIGLDLEPVTALKTFVFEDQNRNGLFNPRLGETGIEGVRVILQQVACEEGEEEECDGDGHPVVIGEARTNERGLVGFLDVPRQGKFRLLVDFDRREFRATRRNVFGNRFDRIDSDINGGGRTAFFPPYNDTLIIFFAGLNERPGRRNFSFAKAEIEEAPAPAAFSIFPNPATSSLRLDLQDYQGQTVDLRLTDQQGRVLWQQRNLRVDQALFTLDLQQLRPATGLYSVSLITGSGVQTRVVQIVR